ncbi:hypothetical protein ACFQ3J_20760 [Paenibacillus provencensis]|uniref:Uncharacterized protein n=1 Tax=Paenibacillus provencensis TaxID=441151 RepID=A0ABW3PZH8_9BACL
MVGTFAHIQTPLQLSFARGLLD